MVSASNTSASLCRGSYHEGSNIFLEGAKLAKIHAKFDMETVKGQLHLHTGNYKQAMFHFRRALRDKKASIITEDNSIKITYADILYAIGYIHLTNENFDAGRGIQALQFCYELRCACFGRTNALVVLVLIQLAHAYSCIDEPDTALQILSEAQAALFSTQGISRELADIWQAMGQQLKLLAFLEDAAACFEESARVLRALQCDSIYPNDKFD